MVPNREIFWNISYAQTVYVLGALVIGIILYTLIRRIRFWRIGKPNPGALVTSKRTNNFIKLLVIGGIFHRKLLGIIGNGRFFGGTPRELYPGLAHLFIFGGSIILLLGTFLDSISHYFFHFLNGSVYLVFSTITDASGLLVFIGAVMFLVRRYGFRPKRLDNKPEDLIIILLILVTIITGFAVEGFRIAAVEVKTSPDWARWSPGGYMFAQAIGNLSEPILLTWHRVTWWIHLLVSFGAIGYVALFWNKLSHLLTSPLNVFFRSLEPKGTLNPLNVQTPEYLGIAKLQDFTWKDLLDLDACTQCGRCQDICPAYLSGKVLSPKRMVQNLKTHWLAQAPNLVKGKPGPIAPKLLIGDVVSEDEIWSCTTCGGCREVCPVSVEHLPKIIGIRRYLMDKGKVSQSISRMLEYISIFGNPWGYPRIKRTDWASKTKVDIITDTKPVDFLYWVGCAGAYDPTAQPITLALLDLMREAKLSYAILGGEETCCGEPARRLGEEGLFQELARQNIRTINKYSPKMIVTNCPHCYNTLKNEYSQFGGNFIVKHHTELISELLLQSRVKAIRPPDQIFTFHDPCYLGRYNNNYTSPRYILSSISKVGYTEMERNREYSRCCGAGGGSMWIEQVGVQRMNYLRFNETQQIGAKIVVTACPYCKIMLDEAATHAGVADQVRVKDIAELISVSKNA